MEPHSSHQHNAPHQQQQSKPEKSVYLLATEGLAWVLSFIATVLVAPTLIDGTTPKFVAFMSRTLAPGFSDIYEIFWGIAFFMLILFLSLSIFSMIIARITIRYTANSFK